VRGGGDRQRRRAEHAYGGERAYDLRPGPGQLAVRGMRELVQYPDVDHTALRQQTARCLRSWVRLQRGVNQYVGIEENLAGHAPRWLASSREDRKPCGSVQPRSRRA